MPELNLPVSRETLNELLVHLDQLSESAREELRSAAAMPDNMPASLATFRTFYADCWRYNDSATSTLKNRFERAANEINRLCELLKKNDSKIAAVINTAEREQLLRQGSAFFDAWYLDVRDMEILRDFVRSMGTDAYNDICNACLVYPELTDIFELVDSCLYYLWLQGLQRERCQLWHQYSWSRRHEYLKSMDRWEQMAVPQSMNG